jgi:agarase
MDRIPYFANGWIIGDFKTVSSGLDYWAPLPDPFDSKFLQQTQSTVAQIAREVKGNPWCVGIFIDNEKSWGQMGSIPSQYGISINGLAMDAQASPTKARFSVFTKESYSSIEALNKAWETNIDSWKTFDKGITVTQFNDALVADLSSMLTLYAEEYFKVVSQTVKQAMPNHMYLGARFASWGMTPEVRNAAAKYADVMSYNNYKEGLNPDAWQFLDELDKPSIIGEFHMGSADTGIFNPGLVLATDQNDRARLYSEYMNSVADNPYFVGAHWFQYIDSPISGRAYDGENYNVGFVSVADVPYKPMIDAAKKFNKAVYSRRFKMKEK